MSALLLKPPLGLIRHGEAGLLKAAILRRAGEDQFDRQIVAIALVEGATAIYSDDDHVCAYAKEAGIESYELADLPLPPEDPQQSLPFVG